MKRRDFILASGSTVLSGLATSQIQRSAIGLDFEISTPDKDPSKVDSLLIEFETLEITPRYLDENEALNVQAKVEVANQTKKSNEVQTSVVNGRTKNLENSIDSIVVDGLNASSSISGDVTVSIDHPDIQDSYSHRFYVNGSEIPNSEADSKLIHRWGLDDVNGTVEDRVGNADGTVNGVTSVSGDWVGGFAGEGDGTGYIALPSAVSTWISNVYDGAALAFTLKDAVDSDVIFGSSPSDSDYLWVVHITSGNYAGSDGELGIYIRNGGSSYAPELRVYASDVTVYDSVTRRIVVNLPANFGSNDVEIWFNQTEQGTDEDRSSSGVGDMFEPDPDPYLFGQNWDGSPNLELDGIVDDFCLFDSPLTSTEIQSYNNPWE